MSRLKNMGKESASGVEMIYYTWYEVHNGYSTVQNPFVSLSFVVRSFNCYINRGIPYVLTNVPVSTFFAKQFDIHKYLCVKTTCTMYMHNMKRDLKFILKRFYIYRLMHG